MGIIRDAAKGRRLVLVEDASEPTGLGEPARGLIAEDGITLMIEGRTVPMALFGAHNLANAHAAWRTARAAGVGADTVAGAFAALQPVPGRLVPKPWGGHLILDDTYNANPASMVEALRVLAGRSGQRLAVLGAMGELGAEADAGHREVGAEAARLGLMLIAVAAPALAAGCHDAGGEVVAVADVDAAQVEVRARLTGPGATILVKASRSQRLERVVDGLLAGVAPC